MSTLSARLKDAALLVVDIQPIYTNQVSSQSFERNVVSTLSSMRKRLPARKIIHVRAQYSDTPMRAHCMATNPNFPQPGPDDTCSTSWARAVDGETIIFKSTFDGFHLTSLEDHLRREGVLNVIMCGMLTSICIHSTALGAVHRGFAVTLVENACLDRTPERHASVLGLYNNCIYQSCTVEDLCGAPLS
jgi:nicotinamidase-related amidase